MGTPLRHAPPAAALLVLLAGCGSSAPVHDPEKLDVVLNVLADGSIQVEERSEVRFEAEPASRFHRFAPVWHHDGVFDVSGWMDGKQFPQGEGPGRLKVSEGPGLDVTWQFDPVSASSRVFTLRYRVANAVEISGIRGTVSWRVLDASHGYDGAVTCVRLTIPQSAVVLENPGFEEDIRATGRDSDDAMCATVAGGQSLTRRVTFTIDGMAVGEPSWQYFARRARDLMPAFVSTAICLVAVGIGIVALVRFRYPTPRPGPDQQTSAAPAALQDAIARGWPYGYHLDKLIDAGLVDRERVSARRDLRRAGIATIGFGLAAWIFTWRELSHFGVWPMWIPASIVLCGILFMLESRRFSVLSQNGVNVRARVLYSARVPDGRTPA